MEIIIFYIPSGFILMYPSIFIVNVFVNAVSSKYMRHLLSTVCVYAMHYFFIRLGAFLTFNMHSYISPSRKLSRVHSLDRYCISIRHFRHVIYG